MNLSRKLEKLEELETEKSEQWFQVLTAYVSTSKTFDNKTEANSYFNSVPGHAQFIRKEGAVEGGILLGSK